MNYIVVYRQQGEPKMEFFKYRDESDVAYKRSTLIRNEDDVIDIMQTLLNVDDFSDAELIKILSNALMYL